MRHSVSFLLIGLITFGVYGNSLDNQFVFDDYLVLVDNPQVRLPPAKWPELIGLTSGQLGYRPVRTLSYALDYRLGGTSPFIYHLLNVIYHILCSFLVFRISLRMLPSGNSWTALCAALLFALHPIQTDAVTYISGRRDVLAGLFFLLGFYAFLLHRAGKRRLLTLPILTGAYLLGGLTKESVLILPAVFFVYDFCREYRRERGAWANGMRTFLRHGWLYIPMLVAGLSAVYYYFFGIELLQLRWHGGNPWSNFATVPRIWLKYFQLLVFPVNLNADYSYFAFPVSQGFLEWRAASATLVLVGFFALIYFALRKGWLLEAFCGLWLSITLLPVSHIIPFPEMVAEHYLYLPCFGFCLLVALVLMGTARRAPTPRWRAVTGFGLLATLLVLYAARTVVRNNDWQDGYTLWKKTVETAPACVRAHHNLGIQYVFRGEWREAAAEFDAALSLNPNYVLSLVSLGEVYYRWADVKKAFDYGEKAIRLDPDNFLAQNLVGWCYVKFGRFTQAVDHFQKSIAREANFPDAYRGLSVAYEAMGKTDMARHWAKEYAAMEKPPSLLNPFP